MLEDLCEHLNPYIWLFAIHLNFNIKTKKNLNCIFNIVVIGVTLQVSFTIMHQIIIDQLLNALKFQIANNNCIRLNEKYIICLNVLQIFEQEHYRHWMFFPKTYLIPFPLTIYIHMSYIFQIIQRQNKTCMNFLGCIFNVVSGWYNFPNFNYNNASNYY